MTVSLKQLRPYMLDNAEVLAVVLEEKLRPDIVEAIDFVRGEMIWMEKHMWRRKGIRPRCPTVSRPVTDVLDETLKAYALAHPNEPQHLIGPKFGVSGARVNEALNGKLPIRKIRRPAPTMVRKILNDEYPLQSGQAAAF
jgi:hypothetical protein